MKIQRKKTLKHISRRKSISRRRRESKPISRRKRYSRKMKGGNPFCKKYKRDIARLTNENTKLKEDNEKLKPLENTPAKRSPIYHTLHTPPDTNYAVILPTKRTPSHSHTTHTNAPNAPFRKVISPSRPDLPPLRDIPLFNLEDVSSA